MIQQEIQFHSHHDFQQQIDNQEQENDLIEQDFYYESEDNEMQIEDIEEQYEENNEKTDVVSNQVLLKQLEKLKYQVQEKCSISPDNAIELLRFYNWKIEKLEEEYFQNPNIILLELQIKGDYNNHDLVSYPKDHDKPEPCQNCQYESPLIQQGCTHKICQNCLQQSIIEKIQQGVKKIPCLIQNCVYKLPTSMISSIISKQVVDDFLVQEYVSSSDELTICKNEKCQRILKRPSNPFLIVNCVCEQTFCFKCKLENHAPVICEQANNWLLDIEDFQMFNQQLQQQLDKGYQEFQQYQQEYIFLQNRYQLCKEQEMVNIQNIKALSESDVETILKAFQEILSITLLQKWLICFEYQTYKIGIKFNQQIKCNRAVLVKTKEQLFKLINQILQDLLLIDVLIHYQLLRDQIRELGANRVISENQRKVFEQEFLQFQFI